MLTIEEACAGLNADGFPYRPSDLSIEARENRWLVRLSDGRMAWFPFDNVGLEALRRERRILDLIARHCTFAVPRVLFVSRAGWDLREPVRGVFAPSDLYQRLQGDEEASFRLGGEIGRALAEQHAIPAAALAGWLKTEPGWPLPRPTLTRMLGRVTGDAALKARIGALLDRYEAFNAAAGAPVLTHGDLGLHNIVLKEDGSLAGLFDYDGAALADRHHDFKYLLFDTDSEAMLEGAIAAYEPAAGVKIDRDAVRLLNASCAVGFLAFRDGHEPDEPWCGRTLAQDLAWTDFAMRRAAG